MADAPKKSDFLKTYIWGMTVVAVVLGVILFKVSHDRDLYSQANEDAPSVFGIARPEGTPIPETKPRTISGLAIGVLKYLETYAQTTNKTREDGNKIPITLVKDTASGEGMNIKGSPQEQTNPVSSKGYEDVYANFTFEPTDLGRLANFMYTFEHKTTKYRILDFRWDLRVDRENPLVQGVSLGNLVQGPSVKIAFRRPKKVG